MNIAALLLHPFELELKTKISQGMINEALALRELPAPLKKVAVELLNGTLTMHIKTTIPLMNNLRVDAKITGIKLSKKESIVHCELMGTAGNIINMLLRILKGKITKIRVKGNILEIDITDILLKLIPDDAANLLEESQVHILSLEPGFLNLGIRKR